MKRAFCIALLAGGIAAPAVAADIPVRMPVKAPVVAPMFNWTGFYAGVNGGYAWADGSATVTEDDTATTVRAALDLDSWFVGLQAGYNYQLPNNVVLGIEGDIQWADGSDRVFIAYANGTGNVGGQLDWFGTLRARLGIANGQTLYYLTGGLAWPGAKFDVFIPFDVTSASFGGKPKFGWVAGAGIEWVLRDNWTAKFEYQYLNFGARTVNALSANGAIAVSGNFDLDMHTLRLGLNYRFASGR